MKLIRLATFAGALLLATLQASAQLSLTNGLIAQWSFEDPAGGTNVQDSVGPHHGVLSTNGTSFDPGGISGQAMRFNSASNGFVNMGDTLSLSNGNFSLVAWVKLEAGDTTDNRVVIARHDGGYRNGYFLVVNTSTNILTPNVAHFVIGGTGTAAQTDAETPSSTTEVNQDGDWHLLVATHSNTDGEAIYVDGAPVEDTAPFLGFNTVPGIDFLLGGFTENGRPKGVFNGLIDEVRIYDRPLNPFEIDQLYRLHNDRREAINNTVAGAGTTLGDNGPAFHAQLNGPKGVVVDASGAVYFSDTGHHRVRRIDPATGIITTIVGTGTPGFSGDGGQGTNAQVNLPRGLALAGTKLLIADGGNHRVRALDLTTGVISHIAGAGTPGSAGDGGPAIAAELNTPMDIAVDATGNIFVSEFDGHLVRRIDGGGTITRFAGTGTAGFSAVGGAATNTPINIPAGITFDAQGRLYIAEFGNNVIRRVDPATGQTEVFAGNRSGVSSGDGGNALLAGIPGPDFMAISDRGVLYVTEWNGHRVRAIDLFSRGIVTVAGTGVAGFAGEGGPATQARFRNPSGLALAPDRSLLLADNGNNRLRKLQFSAIGALSTANLQPGQSIPLFTDNTTFRFAAQGGGPVPWVLVDTNVLEVIPGTGNIVSTQSFHGLRLHAEFMTPTNGQNGNSGIFFQGRYEVQIFNSFGVPSNSLGGNDCGAIWGQTPPATNACLPPGQWQTYDIEFYPAQWNGTNKVRNARATVVLNGVVVQNDVEIPVPTQAGANELPTPGPLLLQDNGSNVRFRNVTVTPFDTPPPVEWVRAFGNDADTVLADRAEASVVDSRGNVFVTGGFGGQARFGTNTVNSVGGEDVFLAKYAPNGDLLWVTTGGGPAGDRALDVAVDPAGNPVITGIVGTNAVFGSTSTTNAGMGDFFVAKYDASGNLLWVQAAGGIGPDDGRGVATDRQGAIFVTGNTSNGGRLGSFMIKFAPNGALVWSRSGAGFAGDTEGLDVVADEQGGAYFVGETAGDAQFGNLSVANTGSQEAYLLHIDATGDVRWVNRSSGPGSELATSIARAPDGSLYIEGWSTGDAAFGGNIMLNQGGFDTFVIKATPQGSFVWLRQLVRTSLGGPRSVAADAAGGVYVTANYRTNANVGAVALTGRGGEDGIVAKYDATGSLLWVRSFGGPEDDVIGAVSTSPTGHAHLVGAFSRTVDFGAHVLSSRGAGDLFVARLGPTLDLPPTAHWRFDEITDPMRTAEVSGSFPGRLSTGAVFTAEAFSTNAVNLLQNTNGFVDFGNLPFDVFQPVTISLLVRTLAGDTNHFILLSDHNADTGRGLLLGLNGLGTNHHPGTVFFTPTGNLQDAIITPAPANDGRWHSLIVTYEPFLGAKLFIDGQPRGMTPPRPLLREGGRVIAGGAIAGGQPFGAFDGWLDELIIYNRVLAPEEINQQALYPEETVLPPPLRAKFSWVREINATGGSRANAVVEDGEGNVYVTGRFGGAADFGGMQLFSRGSNDVFLAKYDANGALVWARQGGGSRNDEGVDLTLDRDGNIIVCGTVTGPGGGFGSQAIFFDSVVFFTRGFQRGFFTKYNPSGQVLLAKELWGPATAVDTDSVGNIYLGGNLLDANRVDLHTIELTPIALSDVWVARFSSVGNPLWAYSHGGVGNDSVTGLRIVNDSAFYLAGNFTENMFINGLFLRIGNAAQLPFVFRHSTTDGNVVWTRQGTNGTFASVQSLALDGFNARVSGRYLSSLAFGNLSLTATNTNGFSGFSATLDSFGNPSAGFPIMDNVSAAIKERPDSLYLAGDFRGSTRLDTNIIASAGQSDTLILRRDAAGVTRLVKHITSPVDVEPATGTGLATDRFGNVYLAGTVTAPTNTLFSVRFDDLRIAPTNQQTAFVTRMNSEVTIVRQPQNVLATNLNATFLRVYADSPVPVSYQWFHNSNAIPGANTPGLFLDTVQKLQPGAYHVIVSNNLGYAVSAPAQVIVELPPVFAAQPTNTSVQVSQTATISAIVAGNPPLSLQWHYNGTPITDATNQTLTIPNAQSANEGVYQLFATNQFGSRASTPVALTVLVPGLLPEIQTQPASRTNAVGSTLSLTVGVTGEAPLFYQWFKNGSPLANRRDAVLAFASLQLADAGTYHVVVSNLRGSVISSNATLAVFAPTPVVITAHPQATNVLAGQDIVLSVTATGSPLIRYQWLRGATAIPGATNAVLTIPNAPLNAAGSYRVQVFNDISAGQSNPAQVNVHQAPVFVRQPSPMVVTNAQFVTISVDVQGVPTPTLQWFKDNVALTNNNGYFGVNTTNLTIPAAVPAHIGDYHVLAVNSVGQQTSTTAPLSMNFPPRILNQPQSITLPFGTNHTFSLSVTGAPPITLRWVKDGRPLPFGTNSTLSLTNLHRADSGIYHLTATNHNGATVSSNALLRVIVPQRLKQFLFTNGGFEFLLGDADGSNLVATNLPLLEVQLSSNLVNWITATNSLIYTNGQLLYRDDSPVLPARRYYRVIEP